MKKQKFSISVCVFELVFVSVYFGWLNDDIWVLLFVIKSFIYFLVIVFSKCGIMGQAFIVRLINSFQVTHIWK